MSSSNRVRLAVIEETTLGVVPPAGNFSTVRFTSESLSGTPTTTESQQIRSDRQSSGQIVTGLEVGGDIEFELCKDPTFEQLLASVMMNTWETQVLQTVDLELTVDNTNPLIPLYTLVRDSGDWNTTLDVGDIFVTTGFTNTQNNTQFQVLQIVSATVIRVSANAALEALVAEEATGTTYKRGDRINIGTITRSFSMEKAFLDLTNKALIYNGMNGSTFDLNVAYGEIVTGSLGFSGTKRTEADSAVEFITNGRTINPASSTNSMNGSVDMPFISSSILGTMEGVDFCIQSLALALDNNLSPQNCIGLIGPKSYSAGTAAITVDLSSYLGNDNWEVLAKKLSQEAFSIGFLIQNLDGWYGFYIPAIQVSFDDPSSGGANQDISIEMSGTAKIGANGENALYIYRS